MKKIGPWSWCDTGHSWTGFHSVHPWRALVAKVHPAVRHEVNIPSWGELKFPTSSFLNNFRDNFNVSMQRWTVERNSFSRWNSLSLWRSTGMSKEMMLCPTSTGFSKPFKNSMKSRRAAWTFTVSTLWPLQNIWLSLEENRIPVTLLAASDILFLGTTYLFMTAVPHTADNCTISEVLSRPVVSKSKWTKLSVPLRVGLEGMMQFSSSVIGELNSMFSE